MQLRDRYTSPPGGFYFVCEDGRRIDASSLRRLDIAVRDYLSGNGMPIPGDLYQIIEDQICERVPASSCWKGFGDRVANFISAVAGAVDEIAGTKLQPAAKACSTCGKRRRTLNRISR